MTRKANLRDLYLNSREILESGFLQSHENGQELLDDHFPDIDIRYLLEDYHSKREHAGSTFGLAHVSAEKCMEKFGENYDMDNKSGRMRNQTYRALETMNNSFYSKEQLVQIADFYTLIGEETGMSVNGYFTPHPLLMEKDELEDATIEYTKDLAEFLD